MARYVSTSQGDYAYIEWKDLERALKDLEIFAAKAVPFALRNALNAVAFEARRTWQLRMHQTMVLRSKWTERSALVDRAEGLETRTMFSEMGSELDYLEKQEEGFTETKSGKHGIPIPTSFAAGQEGAAPRTRLVSSKRWLTRLNLPKRPGAISRQARNYAAMAAARKAGTRHVLLELRGGRIGIFEMSGGLGNVQHGRQSATLKMIWDLSHSAITVDRNPTLSRAVKFVTEKKAEGIAERELMKQLKLHRIFDY